MSLPSSGQISLDDIHVVAGGTTGTQVSINDTDVRGLISSTVGTSVSFSDFYGASSGPTYYRYIKFVFKDVSSSIQELQVRHINVEDSNGTFIPFSTTAVSSGWTGLNNVQSNDGIIAYSAFSSGVTSFYIDCGANSQPYSYEILSNDSSNPNRIPTEWDVYVSNSTTFPSTPHHTIDFSYYSYATSRTHGWDWRTYSDRSTTSLISSNPTLYGDINGNYYTSSGTGRRTLWSSSDSNNTDILSKYYTVFLRVNFGSRDPNASTRDTFTLYT